MFSDLRNLHLNKKFIIISLILVLHLFTKQNNVIYANPIYTGGDAIEMGSLLPSNTKNNLSMTEAEVLMKIDSTNYENKTIEIDFYGKYLIHNPNETMELILAAPFYLEFTDSYNISQSSHFKQVNDSMQIVADGNEINFSHTLLEDTSGWEDYLANYEDYHTFFIANITFIANSTTELIYTWKVLVDFNSASNYIVFYYDVGTARGWSGNLTERVTCEVLGEQPTSYTDQMYGVLSKHCIITDFENGKNYSWFWDFERITDYYVGVAYSIKEGINLSVWEKLIIVSFLIIIPIIAISIIIIKK